MGTGRKTLDTGHEVCGSKALLLWTSEVGIGCSVNILAHDVRPLRNVTHQQINKAGTASFGPVDGLETFGQGRRALGRVVGRGGL